MGSLLPNISSPVAGHDYAMSTGLLAPTHLITVGIRSAVCQCAHRNGARVSRSPDSAPTLPNWPPLNEEPIDPEYARESIAWIPQHASPVLAVGLLAPLQWLEGFLLSVSTGTLAGDVTYAVLRGLLGFGRLLLGYVL